MDKKLYRHLAAGRVERARILQYQQAGNRCYPGLPVSGYVVGVAAGSARADPSPFYTASVPMRMLDFFGLDAGKG